MMEDIMDLVLGLNAQGLALMANDDFDPAIEDIRTALDQIRHISQFAVTVNVPQVFLSNSALSLTEDAFRRVEATGDVLLGQGFSIQLASRHDPKLSLQDTSLLTSILLFNLGLAYHLRGLSTNNVAQASDLRMAMHLYQHAMGLSIEQSVPIDPRIALLLVAMGNNMCSVAASMGKLQDLSIALEWTKIYSRSVAENVPFFWMNVTFWDNLGKTPAAAA